MGFTWLPFSQEVMSMRWLTNLNQSCRDFIVIFGAYMNVFFIVRVKILVLVKWSYRSLRLRCLLKLERLSYFEHIVQSLSNICLPLCLYLEAHLITYHSNLGGQLR